MSRPCSIHILLGCLVLSSPLAAQTRPAPSKAVAAVWALVPPLPTSCYSNDDRPPGAFGAARERFTQELESMKAANKVIEDRVSADPMALASRMQDYMMKNPEAGAKLMQEMGEVQGGGALIEEQAARTKEFEAELESLERAYKAEYGREVGPLMDRWGLATTSTSLSVEQFNAIVAAANAAYEKFCPPWFLTENGKFPVFLTKLRAWYLDEALPPQERLFEIQRRHWSELYGVDTKTLRFQGAHSAALEYIRWVERAFGHRAALRKVGS